MITWNIVLLPLPKSQEITLDFNVVIPDVRFDFCLEISAQFFLWWGRIISDHLKSRKDTFQIGSEIGKK